MKIGILGAGNIGGTLGRKWLTAGHTIVFGVRDLNSPKTISTLNQVKGATAAGVSTSISRSTPGGPYRV